MKSRLSLVGKYILVFGSIVDVVIGVVDGIDGDSFDEGVIG